MTPAACDLRDLVDELDAAITAWPRGMRSFMQTRTGKKAEALVRSLRAKMLRYAVEGWTLRARLRRAEAERDGARAANEVLTAELERLRGP